MKVTINFMKKYSLVSLAIALFMIGCTSTDGFFGSDMIPPSQAMKTRIDSSLMVKTYQISMDSAATNNMAGWALIGSMIDPWVGRTTMDFIANYTPIGFNRKNTGDTMFGKNPRIDSMIFALRYNYDDFVGDTNTMIDITIYELLDMPLNRDNKYYSNFDPTGHYDPSKPLGKIRTNGQKYQDTVHLPMWFAQKFITNELNTFSETNPYWNDTLWIKQFNGFYFKTEAANSGTGQIIQVDLQAPYGTGMTLYYKNDYLGDSVLYKSYFFEPDTKNNPGYIPRNTSFVIADHDYSYADPSRGGVNTAVIGNLELEQERLYIQSFGGLSARAVVDMKSIKRLKEKALSEGFKHIAVHRAELRWYTPKIAVEYYNDAFGAMTLYLWNKTLSGYIPDYKAMGGGLVRSLGYYKQDISSYVQRLLNGSETNPELNLLPYDISSTLPYRSLVNGSGAEDRAPEIILTYTLIK